MTSEDPIFKSLGETVDNYVYVATCKRCRTNAEIDLPSLKKQLTANFIVADISKRLKCKQCGARSPVICFVTRQYYESHLRPPPPGTMFWELAQSKASKHIPIPDNVAMIGTGKRRGK